MPVFKNVSTITPIMKAITNSTFDDPEVLAAISK